MASKNRQTSPFLIALIAPAILIGSYATLRLFRPSEDRQQVIRLVGELQQVKSNVVPEERRLGVVQQIATKREELAAVQADFDEVRRQAGQMMRAEFEPMMELTTEQDINRILSQAGLRFVDGFPATGNSRRPGLLQSLNSATEQLGDFLTDLASEEVADVPIILPPDFPRDENPILWMEQQRQLRVGNFDGPETTKRTFRLVGDYRSMIAGLEAIVDACPNVVVSNVAFQRPAISVGIGPQPLVWNLQVQMMPDENKRSVRVDAEMMARRRAYRQELENADEVYDAETYTVSKPVAGDSD